MIKVWIIAGNRGSGKSTAIRCLTGIREKEITCVKKADGHYFHIYSFMRSIQEVELGNPMRFRPPVEFCDLLENDFFLTPLPNPPTLHMSHQHSVVNYLVPLRINPANGLPGYVDYVAEMLKRGFCVKSLVMLGAWDAGLDNAGFDAVAIEDPLSYSDNERASLVRGYWGWV